MANFRFKVTSKSAVDAEHVRFAMVELLCGIPTGNVLAAVTQGKLASMGTIRLVFDEPSKAEAFVVGAEFDLELKPVAKDVAP